MKYQEYIFMKAVPMNELKRVGKKLKPLE